MAKKPPQRLAKLQKKKAGRPRYVDTLPVKSRGPYLEIVAEYVARKAENTAPVQDEVLDVIRETIGDAPARDTFMRDVREWQSKG